MTTLPVNVTATDQAGLSTAASTSIDVSQWASLDGRLNAPAGSPQLPTLLNGYSHRPPWFVAGVDYHVGIDRTKYPSNSNLKVPGVNPPPPGCSYSGGIMFIDGSGGVTSVTVDGWNFTGKALQVTATKSPLITNCLFTVDAFACQFINNQQGATTAVGGIIRNCEFNQTQSPAWIAPILVISNASDATNPHIIEYCLFTNSQSESSQLHDGLTNGHIAQLHYFFRYNVVNVCGAGAPAGAHGDMTHTWGGNITHAEVSFNLIYQSVSSSVAATRGLEDIVEQSRGDDLYIKNNTMICVAGSNLQQFASIIGAFIKNLAQVYDNYLDPSGPPAFIWFLDPWTSGANYPANAGRADLQRNIDMRNGNPLNTGS